MQWEQCYFKYPKKLLMRAAIETWNTFEKSRGPFCDGGGDFGKWKNGLTKKRGKNHEKELLKKQKLILLKWEEPNAPSYIYIYIYILFFRQNSGEILETNTTWRLTRGPPILKNTKSDKHHPKISNLIDCNRFFLK